MKLLPRTDHESYKEYAYRILLYNIMEFELKPGDALDESRLAADLKISRMPVHEALAMLANENIVDIFPRKGSYVSKIYIGAVNEGIFLRSTVEPNILKVLIKNISPEYMTLLQENLRRQKSVISQPGNLTDFFRYDDEFHHLLYYAANKPLTQSTVETAVLPLNRIRYLFGSIKDVDLITPSYLDHEKILQALQLGTSPDENLDEFYLQHITRFQSCWPKLLENYSDYFSFD